ncbi:MAG TPA: hypothetical protein DD621_01195 [Clostridiales bacterium]|nr:hypothetical protein [Clostridiales bacterium]
MLIIVTAINFFFKMVFNPSSCSCSCHNSNF